MAGAELCTEWIRQLGLWYEEPDAAADWAAAVGHLAAQITTQFVGLCVQLARDLHASELIHRVLGRPVPVLVHELEYYEDIARWAEAANPPGVADDFVTWVRHL